MPAMPCLFDASGHDITFKMISGKSNAKLLYKHRRTSDRPSIKYGTVRTHPFRFFMQFRELGSGKYNLRLGEGVMQEKRSLLSLGDYLISPQPKFGEIP